MALPSRALPIVAMLIAACSGQGPLPTPAPSVTTTVGPSSTALATPHASTAGCTVWVEPAIAAPGGWQVVVGSGFEPGEDVTWTQAAEDGTLAAGWATESYEPMRPDRRGGFGFGLGSPGADAIGHTISATITAPSCTTHVSWRVEATNEQTGPLPTTSPVACTTERASTDRVDDVPGHQVHLIYALPSDGPDAQLDRRGQIGTALDRVQEYLRQRLDGSTFRLDTCDGKLDITFLRMARTAAEFAAMRNAFVSGVELELSRNGFRRGQKLYVVVWGGLANWARLDHGCGGDAGYQGVAVMYTLGMNWETCPEIAFELPIGEADIGIAHEIVHLLGLPAPCAGDLDETGHVTDDPADLMYGRGHTTGDAIDAGHDDYYRHGIAGCPDLANSAFLDPLPATPELPVGWPAS